MSTKSEIDTQVSDLSADKTWMNVAFAMAEQVGQGGNVPVGATLVVDGKIVAQAGNLRETTCDPTSHAEMLVLKQASQMLRRWRLDDATLYVTLEPCVMCAGAILQSRVKRVVYAAREPKTGAHESVYRLFEGSATLVEQDESSAERSVNMLGDFFQDIRERS